MTNEWTFYLVELTTGHIVADVPLSSFSGERALIGGSMSASLPIAGLPYVRRREYIDLTAPGRYSIAAERNGTIVGEWVIWKRSRSNDGSPIALSGNEISTVLDHRVMGAWVWTGVDQIEIARQLVVEGFAGAGDPPLRPGAVAVTIPAITPSGQLRDRTYAWLDGDIGQRLKELSEVDNGFDYLISPTRFGSTILRTVRFYYPRAGQDLPYVFEMGAPDSPPGNVLALALDEDGTRLLSNAHSIGATSGDNTVTGDYQDLALVTAGWPFMEGTRSWSSVTEQSTIDSYARAFWDDSQSADQPITIDVLADKFPAFGDYDLGDRLAFVVEASDNFPDGYTGTIRVLGWTHNPTGTGPEKLTLRISKEPS
jgi:hypothetical protein